MLNHIKHRIFGLNYWAENEPKEGNSMNTIPMLERAKQLRELKLGYQDIEGVLYAEGYRGPTGARIHMAEIGAKLILAYPELRKFTRKERKREKEVEKVELRSEPVEPTPMMFIETVMKWNLPVEKKLKLISVLTEK